MGRPDYLTIPNTVTLVRLLLVPVFLLLRFLNLPGWALVCFATAAASDIIDGLLARLLNQRSRLGALMDPVADKVLLFSALTALTWSRELPAWLWAGVLARDVFLTGVAWRVKRHSFPVEVAPSRVGKYATFSLSMVVGLLLLEEGFPTSSGLQMYTRVLVLLAGLAVTLSTVGYVAQFSRYLWKPAHP